MKTGRLTRRQFAVSLAALTSGMLTAPGVISTPQEPTGFPAVSPEPRHRESSRPSSHLQVLSGVFWNAASAAVGKATYISLVSESPSSVLSKAMAQAASVVNHYDFGIANFDADAIPALSFRWSFI